MTDAKKSFVAGLWLATVMPMVFFVFYWNYGSTTIAIGIKEILVFLGAAHVPATLTFYRDPRFREAVSNNRLLFYGMPIALTAFGALIFAGSTVLVQGMLLCAFWMWQAYHYGKQNVGVYSFSSIALRGNSIDKTSKIVLVAIAWTGAFGSLKVLGNAAMPGEFHGFFNALHFCGLCAYLAIVAYGIYHYIKTNDQIVSSHAVIFLTLLTFFAPMFFSQSIEAAFMSYAIAHGMQYLVFMAIVAGGTRTKFAPSLVLNLALFVVIILAMGCLFVVPNHIAQIIGQHQSADWKFGIDLAVGAVLGATAAHFVVDAYTWRLSNPIFRKYIGEKFGFVMRGAVPRKHAVSSPSGDGQVIQS